MVLSRRSPTLPDDPVPDDRPEWLARQAPAPAQTTCYRHPDRPTSLRCSRCDRPICGECSRPAPVGQRCPDDASDRAEVRGLPGAARPVVTLSLLAVNAVLLLVEAARSGGAADLLDPSPPALCQLGALNSAAIAEAGQYWRLFTVMVLHAGIIHFALNSYALYAFGPQLEYVLGRARYLALYVGAGFVGAAASFAIGQTVLGVGASGAIFGLLGALVAFFFRRRRLIGGAPLQNLLFIVAINLFLATRIPNIDNLAHMGGFVGGLATMALLDAVPAGNRRLRLLALAAPFVLGLLLTVYGVASFPVGMGEPSCVGA
jgi:membrane associated rhomboid family serine protease